MILPNEIVQLIFKNLSIKELLQCRLVCKLFYINANIHDLLLKMFGNVHNILMQSIFINNNKLWKIYKKYTNENDIIIHDRQLILALIQSNELRKIRFVLGFYHIVVHLDYFEYAIIDDNVDIFEMLITWFKVHELNMFIDHIVKYDAVKIFKYFHLCIAININDLYNLRVLDDHLQYQYIFDVLIYRNCSKLVKAIYNMYNMSRDDICITKTYRCNRCRNIICLQRLFYDMVGIYLNGENFNKSIHCISRCIKCDK